MYDVIRASKHRKVQSRTLPLPSDDDHHRPDLDDNLSVLADEHVVFPLDLEIASPSVHVGNASSGLVNECGDFALDLDDEPLPVVPPPPPQPPSPRPVGLGLLLSPEPAPDPCVAYADQNPRQDEPDFHKNLVHMNTNQLIPAPARRLKHPEAHRAVAGTHSFFQRPEPSWANNAPAEAREQARGGAAIAV